MRTRAQQRAWLAILWAALAFLALAPAARAAASDPLFVFVPTPPPPPQEAKPPPTGYLEGPCGLGVDSSGRFYVSDYYHQTVDIYSASASYSGPGVNGATGYLGQLAGLDPLDGPCGLAFDSSDRLYVNDFHRGVSRFGSFLAFGAGTPIAGVGADEAHPTGVAVDPSTDRLYVDDRTHIAVYESSGAPLEEGGEPVKIGVGTLGEGFGLAVSGFGPTAGRLYVPDATTNTVEVYDPAALDKANPVQTIHGPGKGFTSLRDAAVAVDRVTGNVYVVDDLQPAYSERPQAQIDVFNSTGSYIGVLKYKVIDALPPGLAVDNSSGATQGRVYVTSGNTDQAGIYAYPPGAQTGVSQPPSVGLAVKVGGSGEGQVASELGGVECSSACEVQVRSGSVATLTAAPDPRSSFAGWSGGGCSGTAPACTVAMDEAVAVSVDFEASPRVTGSILSPVGTPQGADAAGAARGPHRRAGHRTMRHRHRRHNYRSHRK